MKQAQRKISGILKSPKIPALPAGRRDADNENNGKLPEESKFTINIPTNYR